MNKTKIFAPLYIALIFCALTLCFTAKPAPYTQDNVYILKETPTGTELIATHNVLTDIFERVARNEFGFDNATYGITDYISLGNSSIDQTNTQLDTEATTDGFARAQGTVTAWTNSGDKAYNVTKKFTATGTIAINSAGLHWASSGDGNLCALASLGGTQTFENNWNCTIVWVITYNYN